ncbi:MAG: hypothetical protein OXE05_06670 [Chloroflexi bacterium]|nr:hypothetical protein [Chloroflexota bacterium]
MNTENATTLLPPLCCYDPDVAPFGRYELEMLYAEGLTGAEERNVRETPLEASAVKDRLAVIVAPCGEDTGAEAAALEALRQGTPVVFLRPSEQTAVELGIANKQRRTANEAYIAPERDHPLWFAALGDFLQFHGTADMYGEYGGRERVLAWIAGRDWALPYPAIVTGAYGAGRFAVFTYDLATSTVLFHQGRREQASTGPNPDADGDGLYSPSDLFIGYRDRTLLDLPQADLQQQLLVRILEWASAPQAPLARLWYYPDAAPAIVLVNGDSDGMTRPQMEWYTNMVEAHGGEYTVYLMEEHLRHLTPEMERDYRQRGHSAGPHIWHSLKPTVEQMRTRIHEEVALFEERYGYPPKTTRHHCVIWPGWVETAKALADAGFRMDTNYRAGDHQQYGYLTGSGLPMRFIDEDGEFIEIYEQETLFCDDYVLVDKSFLPPLSEEQAITVSQEYIDAARDHYHTVVHLYFHPIYATGVQVNTGQFIRTAGWFEAVLKYAAQQKLPMPSTDAWCTFNEQRRTLVLAQQCWEASSGVLHLTVEAKSALPGATLLVPVRHAGLEIAEVLLDGEPMELSRRSVAGVARALAVSDIDAGSHDVAVHFR